MHIRTLTLVMVLAATLGSQAAFATNVALTTDGQWNIFDVDPITAVSGGVEWIDIGDGSVMSFSFTGPAKLTVVDAAFAGDRFNVYDNGVLLGQTSAAVNSYPDSVGLDFAGALANGNYSRGVYLLGAGSHIITGELSLSALDDTGTAFDATVGAVQMAAVPEPGTYALMLTGLGLLGLAVRRRTY